MTENFLVVGSMCCYGALILGGHTPYLYFQPLVHNFSVRLSLVCPS
jgi:hypothetical protein